ncbi:hypothetical protein NL676_008338 [Syzygium grande]|nr:hypothetical protein NL676_008338 [Syzygium grande]
MGDDGDSSGGQSHHGSARAWGKVAASTGDREWHNGVVGAGRPELRLGLDGVKPRRRGDELLLVCEGKEGGRRR